MMSELLLGQLASDLQETWGFEITTPKDGALIREPAAGAGAALLLSQQQDVHN